MGSVLDFGPVNVRGVIRARQARVIWKDGWLYILSRSQSGVQRQAVQTSEPVAPSVPNGYWRTTTPEGETVTFTRRGCSTCGGTYRQLAQVDRQAIIDGTL